MNTHLRPLLLLVSIVLATIPAFTQLDPATDLQHAEMKSASRQQLIQTLETRETGSNFDIHYERMDWAIDPAVNFIQGTVTTYFTALDALDRLDFDFNSGLTIDSIVYHGLTQSDFVQLESQILEIGLPKVIASGQSDSISISYHGVPTGGGFGYWVQSNHQGTPIIWTLSEPYGASSWWPCKQDLSDKIDSMDILVTTPNAYRVASNGVLINEIPVSDSMTRHHWQTHYPIASYLVALGITDYAAYSDYVPVPGQADIEVLNYVYPENLDAAINQTNQVIPVMQLYNELFGLYPFAKEKYGHAQFGWGGGMEHQTMTFAYNFSFLLISHELAHQWFGDKVTCGTWQDIWLNEGFATYCEGLCYEHGLGNQDWQQWLTGKIASVTSTPGGSVFVSDTSSVNRIFDSRLTYNKGALLLHMLRWKLGDEAFFAGIRSYLNDPQLAYGFARTENLKQHLQASSGQDLSNFFQEWYYGEGFPSYHISWEQTDDQLQLTVAQSTSSTTVDFFDMPLPIHIFGDGHDTLIILQHDHSGQEFTIPVSFAVTGLEFDPDHWLISANNTVTQQTSAQQPALAPYSIRVFPNPVGTVLYVKVPGSGNQSYTITDVTGKKLKQGFVQEGINAIPAADLIQGIYLLQIFNANGAWTEKFMKLN
ncbi:MAG: T9SS type A sorting domain-containing protein [Saprospiraceae bacterium]|nr:T9SS type A sorting domain-containing protein [Saprospiraceae bacterium]MCB9319339.1 T9SS type A sorting domain-containing protein [Lewinellaceae bacterium]